MPPADVSTIPSAARLQTTPKSVQPHDPGYAPAPDGGAHQERRGRERGQETHAMTDTVGDLLSQRLRSVRA
jgi:hypothetical protein